MFSRRSSLRSVNTRLGMERLECRWLLAADLVADIRPFGSSSPAELTDVDGTIFFHAHDGVHGRELWSSDGTPAGTTLVRDIAIGEMDSHPSDLINVDGVLYFAADDGEHGSELWRSDGTQDGTALVVDIRSGAASSNPQQLTVIGDKLYFVADDGVHGAELWATDGTPEGTNLVYDVWPGEQDSKIGEITDVDGTAFFEADDGETGLELWRSNGTLAGTSLVRDLRPGAASSRLRDLVAYQGMVVFSAVQGDSRQLWRSDGTSVGTIPVLDGNDHRLEVRGDVAFSAEELFVGAVSPSGSGLWRWNDEGIQMVWEVTELTRPMEIQVENGDSLYFRSPQNNSWYRWNGKTADYVQLSRCCGLPFRIELEVNGLLFGRSNGSMTAVDLDANSEGTEIMSSVAETLVLGDVVYISGRTPEPGIDRELWKFDTKAQSVELEQTELKFSEGQGKVGFRVLRGRTELPASAEVVVHWSTAGSDDVTFASSAVPVFQYGETSTTLFFDIIDDELAEAPESFELEVRPTESSTQIGTNARAKVTITDNDVVDLLFTGNFRDIHLHPGATQSIGLHLNYPPRTDVVILVEGSNDQSSLVTPSSLTFTAENWNTRQFLQVRGITNGTMAEIQFSVDRFASDPAYGLVSPHRFTVEVDELGLFDLVRDTTGLNPHDTVVMGGVAYFTAVDGAHGRELWRTDGTANGTRLVKDIAIGQSDSMIESIFVGNSNLYFYAQNQLGKWGFWKSDGTEVGTVMLIPIPRVGIRQHATIAELENVVYFSPIGSQLWRSDGTVAGTKIVDENRSVEQLFSTEDRLYQADADGLFVSDGEGTAPRRILSVTSRDRLRIIGAVNDLLLFSVQDETRREALWVSDGTSVGTKSIRRQGFERGRRHLATAVIGDSLIFSNDGVLWASDGTEDGTRTLSTGLESWVFSLYVDPYHDIALVGSRVYFYADGQLWSTDGTQDGTLAITNVPAIKEIVSAGDRLFFQTSSELWTSDGTALGTRFVKRTHDLPIANGQPPANHLVHLNGEALFPAESETTGVEFWRSDGAPSGTQQVFDLSQGRGSDPEQLIDVDGTLYFSVSAPGGALQHPTFAPQFWKAAGNSPELVLELPPPLVVTRSDWTVGRITKIATAGGKLYVAREYGTGSTGGGYATELWVSDGTPLGTKLLSDRYDGFDIINGSSAPSLFSAELHDELLFDLGGGALAGLARTDGETIDVLLNEVLVRNMVRVGERVFFGGVHWPRKLGNELWVTDGTVDGTRLVKDINEGGNGLYNPSPLRSYNPLESKLIEYQGNLIFTADDGTTGIELWRSDGTEAGTVLVRDIYPGENTSNPDNFVQLGDAVLFTAYDDNLAGLWRTDGTAEGTRLLKGKFRLISRGPDMQLAWPARVENWNDSTPQISPAFLTFGNVLFFMAETDVGRELWRSDGTEAGTYLVKDIFPGKGSSDPAWFVEVNGYVYFAADDGVHGREVWRTDGTAAGTTLAIDIWPGSAHSDPRTLVNHDNNLVFVAHDGVHGRELINLGVPLATPYLLGDINGDGVLGFPDFLILSENFGKSTVNGQVDGDLNGDGEVDFRDFLLLSARFV